MGMAKIVDVVLKRSFGFTILVFVLLYTRVSMGIVIENTMRYLRLYFIGLALYFVVRSILRHQIPKIIAWHKFVETVLGWAQLTLEIALAFAVYNVSQTFLSPTITNFRFFHEYKVVCCIMGIWAAVDNGAISCLKASIISFFVTPIGSFLLIRIFKKNQSEEERKATAVDWTMDFLFKSPIEGNQSKEEERLPSLTLKQRLNGIVAVGILALLAWSTFGGPFAASHLAKGDELYSKGKYDRAVAQYDIALETDSQNANIYIKRGNAYKKQGINSKAIADYSKALEIDPQNVEAYMSRGEAYKMRNEYDKAIADYSKALEIDPQNVEAHNKKVEAYIKRGKAYESKKKYDEALADYNKVIELDSQSLEAYLGRAGIYISRKNFEGALMDSNKALEIAPESAKSYSIRGKIRKVQGDYDNAISDFTKAIQFGSSGETAKYYYERGNIFRLLVDREHAVADAMKTDTPASTLSDYGKKCSNNKNYSEAIFYFTKSIEQRDSEDVHFDRGEAYLFAGDYAQALVDLTKTINSMEDYIHDPDSTGEAQKWPNLMKASAYFDRGYIYQQQQDIVSAIENYTKAIDLAIEVGTTWEGAAFNNRGICYSDQGDVARAIADYTKAIEFDPNKAMYYNNRGRAHRKIGNTGQAEADFAKARELEAQ